MIDMLHVEYVVIYGGSGPAYPTVPRLFCRQHPPNGYDTGWGYFDICPTCSNGYDRKILVKIAIDLFIESDTFKNNNFTLCTNCNRHWTNIPKVRTSVMDWEKRTANMVTILYMNNVNLT